MARLARPARGSAHRSCCRPPSRSSCRPAASGRAAPPARRRSRLRPRARRASTGRRGGRCRSCCRGPRERLSSSTTIRAGRRETRARSIEGAGRPAAEQVLAPEQRDVPLGPEEAAQDGPRGLLARIASVPENAYPWRWIVRRRRGASRRRRARIGPRWRAGRAGVRARRCPARAARGSRASRPRAAGTRAATRGTESEGRERSRDAISLEFPRVGVEYALTEVQAHDRPPGIGVPENSRMTTSFSEGLCIRR